MAPEARSSRFQQALSYVQKGEYASALPILRQILQDSPRDVEALNLMGIVLTRYDKLAEANEYFKRAIVLKPNYYPALKSLATNEWTLKQVSEAAEHFSQVLAANPNDPEANFCMAEINLSRKRFEEANKYLRRSQSLLKNNPRLILRFVNSFLEAGNEQNAINVMEQFSRLSDPETFFQAGLLFVRGGFYDAAAKQFERAKDSYRSPYELGYNLTLAYVKARKYPAAIASAQEFFAKGFRKAELYNLVSEAYIGNGQWKEAYGALRTANQIDPHNEDNHIALADFCLRHVSYDSAIEATTNGLKYLPHSHRLYVQRGAMEAVQGHLPSAKQDFETAAKLAPQERLPNSALALVFTQLDQWREAEDILRKTIEKYPGDWLSHYLLAETLYRSTLSRDGPEEREIVQLLEKSAKLNPHFSHTHTSLGKLLLKRGQLDRAIVELEKAMELDPTELIPVYHLAQAYRKKGNITRADELLARVRLKKVEDLESSRQKSLLFQILREGSQR